MADKSNNHVAIHHIRCDKPKEPTAELRQSTVNNKYQITHASGPTGPRPQKAMWVMLNRNRMDSLSPGSVRKRAVRVMTRSEGVYLGSAT